MKKSSGKHVLDWMPVIIIALVGAVAITCVFQGLFTRFQAQAPHLPASGNSQKVDLTSDLTYQEWLNGADGYKQGMAEHEKTKRPILVYFYAPWCGFCANFHRQILSNPETIEAMKSYIKVRVYPGDNKLDQQLMAEFGATGFPTVYLKGANSPIFKNISMHDAEGNLLPPKAFIDRLKEKALR